jgi:hypothetical protein
MRLSDLCAAVRLSRAWVLAPALGGCAEGAPQLRYTVEFACERDHDLSDELLLRVREGGCFGPTTIYEVRLAKDERAPLGPLVPPGTYGFEAIAYGQGAVLARRCLEASHPQHGPPTVVLESEGCVGKASANPADASQADASQTDASPAGAACASACDAGSGDPCPGCTDASLCGAAGAACATCSTARDCDDANPCTTERCHEGKCRVEPNALPCDDGKSCTVDDVCADLACLGSDVCPAGSTCGAGGCGCENTAETLCDTSCVNVASDAQHCGACGRACGAGASCENGACKPSLAGTCSAQRFGVHDYLVCPGRLSWQSARERCRGYGMGLAIIEDASENDFLRAQIGEDERWIGATDRGDDGSSCTRSADEGAWFWVNPADGTDDHYRPLCGRTGGSPVACVAIAGAYQNWREGDPNNNGCFACNPTCPAGQDCAAMVPGGAWNDYDCDTLAGFVCERP